MTAAAAPLERNCLVTVGATVGFKDLTQVVTEPDFWRFIRSEGFTSLRIQCGPDISWARDRRAKLQDQLPPGLDVVVFDVCKNLMAEEMVLCKAVKGRRAQGLVVSHAGSYPCAGMAADVRLTLLKAQERFWMRGSLASPSSLSRIQSCSTIIK